MLPQAILERLRPHQAAPANWLHGNFLAGGPTQVDLSDTGTGKTYVAAAVLSALQWPTLVVAPKIARTTWERAAAHFGDSFSVIGYEMLRTGRTPFGVWDNPPPAGMKLERHWKCLSCQREVDFDDFKPCYCHPQGIHCIVEKKTDWRYGKFNFAPEIRAVVFDEVHRCGALDSLNADLLIAAKRQGLRILGLSATAACDPTRMRALGYAVGLHTLTGRGGLSFGDWAARHGCRYMPGRGLKWPISAARQLATMAQIRDSIIPLRGVRVRTEDIPGFPERDITAELYDLEESGQIDRLYGEMADPLSALAERQAKDVNPDCALTRILRGRQKIELLKVPIAVELAQDYLDKGYSVALFVNFRATLGELCERLKTQCFIDGSPDGVRYRDQFIDEFQANQQRAIVVNNEAGGVAVSLHDLHGGFPRVGLVFPCFSAVTMRQVFGRLPRDGGQSKCHYRVLFAAKTVEVPMHRALSAKLNNLDALNDADLMPANLQLTRTDWTGLF